MKTENRIVVGLTSDELDSSAVFWHTPDCVFIEQLEKAEPPKEGYRHLVLLDRDEALQVIKALREFTNLQKPTDWFERIRLSLGGAIVGVLTASITTELVFHQPSFSALTETIGGVVGFITAFVWLSKNPD